MLNVFEMNNVYAIHMKIKKYGRHVFTPDLPFVIEFLFGESELK